MGRFHERDPNDYYKTPPAVTRALLARETFQAQVHEPACGDGAISEVLIGAGYDVVSSDLVDRGYGYCPADFLLFPVQADGEADLITNPPFGIADEFVEHAHNLGYRKMAFLLRLAWLEGEARRARLFVNHPPVRVHVFSPRQTLWKGSDPNPRSSGGMAAYAWFVFENGFRGDPTLHWISRAECAVNMKEAS